MKSLLLLFVFLCVGPAQSVASDRAAAERIFASAHRPADLFQSSAGPFVLEVDFKAQLNVPVEGRLQFRWGSKDRWWSKVEMGGGFEQTTVQNGEMRYTYRNLAFTPLAISRLFRLLNLSVDPSHTLIPLKEKDRRDAGSALQCVVVQRSGSGDGREDYCLDPISHDAVSESWGDSTERIKETFADYIDFEGSRYPKKLDLLYDGGEILSASVVALQPAVFDPELLLPPKGAIERRTCPGLVAPVAIQQTALPTNFPPGSHVTRVSFTVLTDGSVSDAQIIDTGGREIDEATLATVRTWKFKPAMCGTDPVVVDVELDFSHAGR